MTTDTSLMGAHALASYQSRMMALKEFGIDPAILSTYELPQRTLARQSREKRELALSQPF